MPHYFFKSIFRKSGIQNLIGAGVLIALATTCTFEPEENFVSIDSTATVRLTHAEIESQDLLMMSDTFELFARSTLMNYLLDFEKASIVDVTVYVDGKSIGHTLSASGDFSIYAPDYTDGYHTITLKAITNSGTGSLADQKNQEKVTWERNWIFKVSRVPAPYLKITKVYAMDGKLVIEWEPSTLKTEKTIDLEFYYSDVSKIKWTYNIRNPQQTQLVDSLFIGGKLNVILTNQSIDPALISPQNSVATTFRHAAIVEYPADGNGGLKIKWNKSLFYKNVKRYSIDYSPDSYTPNIIAATTNGTDTIATTDKIPFGWNEGIVFRTEAKNLKDESDPYIQKTFVNIRSGEPLSVSYDDRLFAPLNPSLGFSINNTAEKIAVLNGDAPESVIAYPSSVSYINEIAVSNHGEYLYYYAYATNKNFLFRMDRAGNHTMVLDAGAVYGKDFNITNLCIGADRYLTFVNYESGSYTRHFYVYDLVDNKKIFDYADPQVNYNLYTSISYSPDGRFLLWHNGGKVNLFGQQNGVVSYVKSLDYYMGSFFNTATDNKILLCRSYEIHIYDPDTGTESTTTIVDSTTNYGTEMHYDPVTGVIGYPLQILSNGPATFIVADPKKPGKLRSILIPANYQYRALQLYNGSLYNGYRKLDLQLGN
jgi:hypothetical protein